MQIEIMWISNIISTLFAPKSVSGDKIRESHFKNLLTLFTPYIPSNEVKEIGVVETFDYNQDRLFFIQNSLLKGNYTPTADNDISWDGNHVLIYQIKSTTGSIYFTAIVNPFEIFDNEEVLWFTEAETGVDVKFLVFPVAPKLL